jgi:ketosteroid isomerase-like protein
VGETDDFLESVLPRLTEADTAFHNGDAGARMAIWSQNDPVTLFGAVFTKNGWSEVGPTFEVLASRFSNCESFGYEAIAVGVSGDLAYLVGIEHTTASIDGARTSYALRVTTIFRRENGEWRVVHRHGDPMPESVSARDQIARSLREDPTR